MTQKFFLRPLSLIIVLLLQFNLLAQVSPVTLHVETAGTLPTLIDESQKYQITDLTLTGNLNGTDIRFIREMAGSDVNENDTNGKLAILNLAEADIVSGGNYYNHYYSTSNHIISNSMFLGCSSLTRIVLPTNVTSIEDDAFRKCTGLTSIVIPNGVTFIGDNAFYDCENLTSIIIPDGVTSIGIRTFFIVSIWQMLLFPVV